MNRAAFEVHQGTRIFFFNLNGASRQEVLEALESGRKQIAGCPAASVLTLTDATDAQIDSVASDALRETAAANKPYVKAGAVVGVSGAKKVIFNMVLMFTRRQMMAFDDLPSARKWLAARA